MYRIILYIVILFLLLTFSIPLQASIVYIKDGSKIEGEIIKETDESITIQSNMLGEITISRENIDRIEITPLEEESPSTSEEVMLDGETVYPPTEEEQVVLIPEEETIQPGQGSLSSLNIYNRETAEKLFQEYMEIHFEDPIYWYPPPEWSIAISFMGWGSFLGMLLGGVYMSGLEYFYDDEEDSHLNDFLFYSLGNYLSPLVGLGAGVIMATLSLTLFDFDADDIYMLDTFGMLGAVNGFSLSSFGLLTDDPRGSYIGWTILTLAGVVTGGILINWIDLSAGTMNLIQTTSIFAGFIGLSTAELAGLFESDSPKGNQIAGVWIGTALMDAVFITTFLLLMDEQISMRRSNYINFSALGGTILGLSVGYFAKAEKAGELLIASSAGLILGYTLCFLLTLDYDENLEQELRQDFFGELENISFSPPDIIISESHHDTDVIIKLPSISYRF